MARDEVLVKLQAAHLQATNMRGDAIREGANKARWFYDGKREAIEEALKLVGAMQP